jgi:uncharacterized protein (TIGR02996 family)
MELEQAILQALHDNPADEASWLALTDWLQEQDGDQRAELLRLHRQLRHAPAGAERLAAEGRIQHLLAAGVRPCMPTLTNSIGMHLVLIPAGTFWMGSTEPDADPEELPLHEVTITRSFYLGVHLITQGQYQQVMGGNPSRFHDAADCDPSRLPIEGLTWPGARRFAQALSELPAEQAAGRIYRLPTEAEWEYACRAWFSPEWPYHFGRVLSSRQANFNGGAETSGEADGVFLGRPSVVGSYPPNAFGLYDLHGNLAEWCQDWFRPRYYRRSPRNDPQGPARGASRSLRGGAWGDQPRACRTSRRIQFAPDTQHDAMGVRVALRWSAPRSPGQAGRTAD